MWAGSDYYESNSHVDNGKIQWLKDFLEENVGDSNLGVLIFQHYGWDSFSKESRWWSSEMRDLELNILCRRESVSEPANPYNVIGIFTGHMHHRYNIRVFAGLDAVGDSVHFDNLTMRSAGAEKYPYGFAIVYLTADSIRVEAKELHYGNWDYWSKPIHVGP